MRVLYFAWVRQKVGVAEEEVAPPAEVRDVAGLVAWLAARSPGHAAAFADPRQLRAAVNQDFADPRPSGRAERRGRLLPARHRRLSHGRGSLVQEAPFDLGAETAALTAGRTDVGGVASFLGVCRADDGLAAMVLEHYPGMTERAIARIAAQAEARWPLTGCTVIHRFGRLLPGEPIVLVLTASAHRAAALESLRLPDRLAEDQGALLEARGIRRRATHAGSRRKAEDDAAAARWAAG